MEYADKHATHWQRMAELPSEKGIGAISTKTRSYMLE
jgi:hypothetical protein